METPWPGHDTCVSSLSTPGVSPYPIPTSCLEPFVSPSDVAPFPFASRWVLPLPYEPPAGETSVLHLQVTLPLLPSWTQASKASFTEKFQGKGRPQFPEGQEKCSKSRTLS